MINNFSMVYLDQNIVLKKHPDRNRYRLFNTSHVKIGDSRYLFVSRAMLNKSSGEVIPGNSPDCRTNNFHYYEKSFSGNKFWWNNWKTGYFEDISMFYIIEGDIFNKQMDELVVYNSDFQLTETDLRLTSYVDPDSNGTTILAYTSEMKEIYTLDINISSKEKTFKITVQNNYKIVQADNVVLNCPIYSIQFFNDKISELTYVDWFYKNVGITGRSCINITDDINSRLVLVDQIIKRINIIKNNDNYKQKIKELLCATMKIIEKRFDVDEYVQYEKCEQSPEILFRIFLEKMIDKNLLTMLRAKNLVNNIYNSFLKMFQDPNRDVINDLRVYIDRLKQGLQYLAQTNEIIKIVEYDDVRVNGDVGNVGNNFLQITGNGNCNILQNRRLTNKNVCENLQTYYACEDNTLSEILYEKINICDFILFSFSTPILTIKHHDLEYKLTVGHSKIHADSYYNLYRYGNAEDFRDKLYETYQRLFGDSYKAHFGSSFSKNHFCDGYIYLLYFCIFVNIDGTNKCLISDSYLPIDQGNDNQYKFSLVFPMGLSLENNKLMVSCGEGDYYTLLLKFDLDEVINSCVHDANRIDPSKYNFHLLSNSDSRSMGIDELGM